MAGALEDDAAARRPATLIDVARVAGVSASTASNALRGRGRMSGETKERVLRTAAELGYAVNLNARNLRTARAGAIGVHLPDSKSRLAYYMDFCFGVADAAEASETMVVLIPRGVGVHALKGQVDGFVLVDPPSDDPVARVILETGMPVVSGDGTPPSLPRPMATVESDHVAMVAAILDLFEAAGACRPALLSAGRTTQWAIQIEAGYEQWTRRRGVRPYVVDAYGRNDPAALDAAIGRLLAGPTPPDAVLAVPSETAVRVQAVARSLGRSAGTDFLLAAYADSPSLALSVPAITAVDLHPRELGRRCAAVLLDLIDNAYEGPPRQPFPIDLIPRGSTGAGVRRPVGGGPVGSATAAMEDEKR